MKHAYLLALVVLVGGCDGTGVDVERGQFAASVTGDHVATLTGDARYSGSYCVGVNLRAARATFRSQATASRSETLAR